MPPNPRDHLSFGAVVPLERVEEVVAQALRRHFQPLTVDSLDASRRLGHEVVERLSYFNLLAVDVAKGPDDRREKWWD